jgi:peptidoglycan/xylan/chitin deacetylase (PgdA/CDA1 family)
VTDSPRDPSLPAHGEALVAVTPTVAVPSVVLTYDDGPDPQTTPAVLRELAAADARATFFVLGTRVKLYPDLLRAAAAEGHEIGLHGADHRRVGLVPEPEFSKGLAETKEMLEQVVQRPVVWYRPPYGHLTDWAWTVVHGAGLTIAGWFCQLWDWKDLPREEHLAGLDPISRSGEVVLGHDAFADARDLVDDGPAPQFDRGLLARAVLDRISSDGCVRPTLSGAMASGTPVWRQWVAETE